MVRASINVNKNNSGAGELTDKNQLLKCFRASGSRVRVRVKIRRTDATLFLFFPLYCCSLVIIAVFSSTK